MQRTLAKETVKKIGETVLLKGWVDTVRDHGKIAFLDLRDRSGLVQCVGSELPKVSAESVVEITGEVKKRPEKLVNKDLATGSVEVKITKIEILAKSKDLPIPIDTDGREIEEEMRLKYRYLDLRRPRLQRNIRLRSDYVQAAREYLFSKDFTEIETPMLTKSTPEGSRDFIVPSRVYPGKFFALPQSPQQYKQLLMSAGFERYFQIARCIRDEDPRADRAYEHTQIDMEMSFVSREDVMKTVEDMTIHAVEKIGGKIVQKPFPVVTYKDAIKKYGADKFDLRSEKQKKEGVLSFAWVVDFPFFEKTDEGGWTFTHNPFSAPINEEHEKWLLDGKNIREILTSQYDLVCNGLEVGGGSIRTHKPEVLNATYKTMGYPEEQIQESVGHMITAFEYGTPPHGGCAQGFERLLSLILDEDYLREVQAFPQSGKGRTSVMDAPSEVTEEQLNELGINVIGKKEYSSPYEAIMDLLKTNGVKYKHYEHKPVFTSQDSARVRRTSVHQGAKALVLQADKEFINFVLPADLSADLDKLQKHLKAKKLRMASKESVKAKTGLEVGCIPPFGSVIGLKTYADSRLGENEEIAFNAARHDRSVKMKYIDFIKLEKPEIIELK